MANNKIQVKRTSVSGRTPNTTNSGNAQYIAAGEFGLNMTDQILYTSDGTNLIPVGANVVDQRVTNTLTIDNAKTLRFKTVNTSAVAYFTQQNDDNFVFYSTNTTYGARPIWATYANSVNSAFDVLAPLKVSGGLVANGSFGGVGQLLASNGTSIYWSSSAGVGTVTQIDSGAGLSGGPIISSGTLSVLANTGIISNATGTYVNATYIGTISSNNSSFLGGVAAASYVQNTDSRTLSGNLVISGTYFNPSANTILLGNSIQRWVLSANSGDFSSTVNAVTSVNSALLSVGTSFIANSTGAYHTGTMNAASHTVGSNFIANSTAIVGTGYANITTSVNSAAHTVGTNFIANSTAIVGTGYANITTSVNSALLTVGTNFIANSTAIVGTGYANITTSVNSALLTVGTSFIANTTGAYHTGVVNAASHTVGSNFIANSTAIIGTGYANITTSVNSALLTVGTSFIANTTGAYHTGVVNAASHTVGSSFIANSTAIVGTGFANITTSVNSALLTVGTAFVANTTGAYHTGTVNAASHTVGTTMVVNTTALYFGTINATSNGITLNSTAISVGNSTVNATINSTAFTGSANNTTYVNGKTESNLNVNNSLTSNNASYLGGTIAASYVQNTDSRTLSGNLVISGTYFNPSSNTKLLGNSTQRWVISANTVDAAGDISTSSNVNITNDLNVTRNVIIGGNLTVSGVVSAVLGNTAAYVDNMIFLNNGIEATITGASGNGTYVTFTANNNYQAGWDVTVTNVNPVAYNGLYTIFSANATHFIVPSTTTTTYVSGGSARGTTQSDPDIGLAAGYNDGTYHHTGIFRDASDGYWKVFDNYAPEPDVSVFIDTANLTFHLADFWANTVRVGNTTVYSSINTTSFSGTANNATNLGGVAAASYVQNTDSRTLSGNITFSGTNTVFLSNVTLTGVIANGGYGSSGQVLTTNGSNVYWSTASGGSANLTTQSTNPSTLDGKLYWNTDLGSLIIYYNDGTSSQWIEATRSGDVGPQGPTGLTGDTGPSGTLSVGSTTTASPGAVANVQNSGNSTVAVLDFTIPRGTTIAVNSSVVTGSPGTSASLTSTGNATFDSVLSFTIPRGTTIAVNSSVTTGSPGSSPSLVSTGNATFDNVLSFTIPRATTLAVNSSVVTGSPGTSPSLTVSSNATFDNVINFTIPRATTLAVNTSVVVGAPGSNPSLSVTSNATFDNVLTFTLSTGATGDTGPQGPSGPKAITIPSPVAGESYTIFWSNAAITIAEIKTLVQGTVPQVNASFFWGTSRASGTTIQANILTSNVTNGNSQTSFANSTPAANSFLWVTFNSISGTVTEYHATLRF